MPFLLVQSSLTPPEVEPVQRALRAAGLFHPLDAHSFVRDAFGVLVKGLSAEDAARLQAALATEGVKVEIVNEAQWPALPPAKRIVRAACEPGLFVPLDPLGRELRIPGEQIAAVCAGLVCEVEFGKRVTAVATVGCRRAPMDTSSPDVDFFSNSGNNFGILGGTHLPADRLVLTGEERNWRWTAEVILAGGLRFTFQAHEFAFGSLGDRLTRDAAANFALFLRDLLAVAPGALTNRGAFALRENSPNGPRYPTRYAFQEETAWLLWRLQQAGHYAPAERA